MAVTVKDNSVQSINSALLRASKGGSGTTVKNVQNVTNVNQTTEIVKLADGTTLDIKGLRQTNSLLTGQIAELERQLKLLKSQVENIGLSSKDSGKTLVFSNYLDVDSETTVPVVVAQYSANGLDWHDTFVEGQDIYIRFSYDAGGEWTDPIKIVGEDGSSYAYYGLVYNYDSMPSDSTGNFFLCGQDFNGYGRLLINDSQLILNENYILSVTRKFQKGYIYVYDGFIWQRLDDKNNFRYVIAMNDLIEIDEPLSPGLIEQFQSSIVVYTPKYLGGFAAAPITAHNGDTFCYTGTTTANYTKGMCYKWADGTGWSLLDPSSSENGEIYMSALNDILALGETSTGVFSSIFSNSLCSNAAFLRDLFTKNLSLTSGGNIKSDNYISGKRGFKINYNGNAEFNDGLFYGKIDNSVITAGTPSWTELVYNGLLIACPAFDFWSPEMTDSQGYIYRLGRLKYYDFDRNYHNTNYKVYYNKGQFNPYVDSMGDTCVPSTYRVVIDALITDDGSLAYSVLKLKGLPKIGVDISDPLDLDDNCVYIDGEYLKINS